MATTTPKLATLPTISAGLGLNRKTLSVIKTRHADFPKPVAHFGIKGSLHLYDVLEVEAWYVARHT
jgi:hypothetical protein